MEAIISEATGQGLQLGAAAVNICARYARHTCCTPALVSAWQMFRAVPPRARSALLYSEMMVSVCLGVSCLSLRAWHVHLSIEIGAKLGASRPEVCTTLEGRPTAMPP